MNWETVVDFLQAMLTPAIAVLTAVIAVAQYRLAKASTNTSFMRDAQPSTRQP